MKLLFLSLMYEPEKEAEFKQKIHGSMPNAVNTFQKMLLSGLVNNLKADDLHIVNSYPFGVFKKGYDQLHFPTGNFTARNNANDVNLACWNLPFLKQRNRCVNAYREMKKYISQNRGEKICILIYTLYRPYLKAANKIRRKFSDTQTCVIVTDLPGKYGLLPKKGIMRKVRIIHSDMILKQAQGIDKFVYLTDAMRFPMRTEKKPYIVVEGIAPDTPYSSENASEKKEKRVFMYAGSFLREFCVEEFAQAFSRISDKDIELWLCGNASESIRVLADKDARIKCLGYLTKDEVSKLQAQADFLVNPRPNRGEYVKYSFPSKTMEYLAAGKPVLMYKLDGIPDEYDEYLNYIQGETVEQIQNSVSAILQSDYEKLKEKAKRGQEFVLTKKCSTVQAKKILDFLAETE